MNQKNNRCRLYGTTAILLFSFVITALLASCGPVNRFTRLKKIPHEYGVNYEAGAIKNKKLFDHAAPWIVFSGRSENASRNYPGGRIKCKEFGFLEPFFVIKEKGEYLRILKYSPDLAEGLKLRDRKKASYYGWIHKSDLLLYRDAVTDIYTGLKEKYIVTLADTAVLNHSSACLSTDSAYVFSDPDLTVRRGAIPLYSIVYLLKKTTNGSAALIASVPEVYTDSIAGHVPGWINAGLLQRKGRQLHAKLYTPPAYAPSLRYVPVFSMERQRDSVMLKTQMPVPLVDRSANFVLNTWGRHITYARYRRLQENLKKINIVFALEGQKEMEAEFPAIANIIQNLIQTLRDNPDGFQYRIGVSTPFLTNSEQSDKPFTVPPSSDFISLIDSLSEVALHMKDFRVQDNREWASFHQGVEMLGPYKDESNMVVFAGVAGYGGELPSAALVKKIVEHNCRILAFQLYAGERFTYDNFVLQMKNLISQSADSIAGRKKEWMVSSGFLRESNAYKQSRKNVYSLDFPDKSMLQGCLLFPEKGKKLALNKLAFAADTLIAQIKQDNRMLSGDLDKAFMNMGDTKSLFTPAAACYLNVRRDSLSKSLMSHIKHATPALFIPTQFPYAADSIPDYYLLLNKKELEHLRSFMDDLASYELDYVEKEAFYLPTGKIRKRLRKYLLLKVNEGNPYAKKAGIVENMKLADILCLITGCPANAPFLRDYTLNDLKKKWLITDEQLDSMQQYIKAKKKLLDREFKRESFISNKQAYYWIWSRLLP